MDAPKCRRCGEKHWGQCPKAYRHPKPVRLAPVRLAKPSSGSRSTATSPRASWSAARSSCRTGSATRSSRSTTTRWARGGRSSRSAARTAKTALAAFLLLLHLCGKELKPNSQLYSAATSRDQAALLFGLAAKIVRLSPTLQSYVTIRDTGARASQKMASSTSIYPMRTHRFGRKIKLPATITIKHQIRMLMAQDEVKKQVPTYRTASAASCSRDGTVGKS
jgi:hypothetical protein